MPHLAAFPLPVLMQAAWRPLPPVRDVVPVVPEDLAAFVNRATALEVGERHTSGVAMWVELASVLQRLRCAEAPAAPGRRHRAASSRRPRRAARGGTVHRDMKPKNVLIDRDGHPYVIDWGGASSRADLGTRAAINGFSPITPVYTALEQARGEGATPRCDPGSMRSRPGSKWSRPRSI